MSLIKREPSPMQSRASRTNGRHSRGPRSARGKATVSRNFLRPRVFSQVVARSMRALGEHPEMHLEDQIERKLRQFYARRWEPVLAPVDFTPKTIAAPETSAPGETVELARQEGM